MSVFMRFPGRVIALFLACFMSVLGPLLIIMTGSPTPEVAQHSSRLIFEEHKRMLYSTQREADTYRGAQTRVMYNRVGKCGSRATLTLLEAVAPRNNITLVLSDINNQKELSLPEQIDLVNYINQLPAPFVYSRHLFYIDFQKLGAVPLVHINIIRDPLTRFVSGYYFKRFGDGREGQRSSKFRRDRFMTIDECVERNDDECSNTKKLFYIVPFFCGQEQACREPGRWAVEKAKATVRDKYLVIGILEEYEDTLKVLEKLLPLHFRGIVDTMHNPDPETKEKLQTMSTKHKAPPSERTARILRFRLQLEYEFYYFVRDRFHRVKKELGIGREQK